MELRHLIAGTPGRIIRGGGSAEITDIAFDSRRAAPGCLFVCVPGMTSDGHDFAPAAVEAGAAALIVERELELDVAQVLVADARAAMAPLAARLFGDPSAELRVLAVTGTNGKTTSAFLLRSILQDCGIPCGLLGTVKQLVGGEEEPVERTTPEAIDLQRTFRRMLDAGDEACAMEVSSHALVLGRADAVHFAAAGFTNLTQDHLDFHSDMEDYFSAKRLLFEPAEGGGGLAPGVAVVNVDDPYGARLAAELAAAGEPRLIRFSAEGAEADLRATDIGFDSSGARFRLLGPGFDVTVAIGLPGRFNVANALTALGLAWGIGVDLADAVAALERAEPVPGRMEPVSGGQPFGVLVDYAHTPDSVENVLRAARGLTEGSLISVIGCGGDRDPLKRPLMGRAGAELSDTVVVTSDNPRSEDPATIIEQVLEGIDPAMRDRVLVEVNRRRAIGMALEQAAPGDLVVIAGKGHEQGQEFEGGRKIPFDDRLVAAAELERLLS